MGARLNIYLLLTIVVIYIASCKYGTDNDINSDMINRGNPSFYLVDPKATAETRALYYNLKKISGSRLLFGHEDALAYGIGWKNEDMRSDVYDVSGSFPSVFGWDIGNIGNSFNIDTVDFARMKYWIRSVYEHGGVNTISWHASNPITGGSPWDTHENTVKHILPGGEFHHVFLDKLDLIADFILDLKSKNGTLIPIIFRPFHEHNGNWFWWGAAHCSIDEFTTLWKFTVEYLRDVKGVNNLLWAYSPDRFYTKQNYLERFPGIDYVDILGFDNYADFREIGNVPKGIEQLRILVHIADSLNKVAALTETGLGKLTIPDWWITHILNPIKNDSVARNIAWMLVWRNANKDHFYAPYPGHPSVPYFLEFESDTFTAFLKDLPPMYQMPR